MITVEAEGVGKRDSEAELREFAQFIERRKVVMIEDLASRFELSTQDCVARIEQMTADGSLSGITDDRGKFISITAQEFAHIAGFIKAKGRISRSELLKEANRAIRLEPTAADLALIQAEAKEVFQQMQAGLD